MLHLRDLIIIIFWSSVHLTQNMKHEFTWVGVTKPVHDVNKTQTETLEPLGSKPDILPMHYSSL